MNNLSNYGVQQLSTQEIKETNGGVPVGPILRWAVVAALAVLNTDWDKAKADFERGYNSI